MRLKLVGAAALALGTLFAGVGGAEARDGCGPGGHRGYYGYCRPNVVYRPVVYRPAFYGYRRVGWYGPRWHRPVAYRPYGWHRGWRGGW